MAKKPTTPTPLPDRKQVRVLLATMFGALDRVPELTALPVIPAEWPLETAAWGYLKACNEKSLPPEVETFKATLSDNLLPELDDLLQMRLPSGNVHFLSAFVSDESREYVAPMVFRKALELVESRIGPYTDRMDKAVEMILGLVDPTDQSITVNDRDRLKIFEDELKRISDTVKAGLPLGASLVFKGFDNPVYVPEMGITDNRGHIPRLRRGDVTLIIAARGSGKTSLGDILAEHNSWVLGHYVLRIQLESDHVDLTFRSMARHLLLPLQFMESGNLDLHNPKIAPVYAAFKTMFEKRKSDINTWFCPGADLHRIINGVKLARMAAEKENKFLLVIIDYMNKITLPGSREERYSQLGIIADALKTTCQREAFKSPMHMIVFDQQSTDAQTGEKYGYGGRQSTQYFQNVIAMSRSKPIGEDVEWSGKPDTLGNQRYLEHEDDKYGCGMIFDIIKANRDKPGQINTIFEGPYFAIWDMPTTPELEEARQRAEEKKKKAKKNGKAADDEYAPDAHYPNYPDIPF